MKRADSTEKHRNGEIVAAMARAIDIPLPQQGVGISVVARIAAALRSWWRGKYELPLAANCPRRSEVLRLQAAASPRRRQAPVPLCPPLRIRPCPPPARLERPDVRARFGDEGDRLRSAWFVY